MVEEEVNAFLKDGKVLLQFAFASVVEAIRKYLDKYNNLLYHDTSFSSNIYSQWILRIIRNYTRRI